MTTLREPFDHTYEKGGFTYVSWSQVADRLDEAAPGWSFAIVNIGTDWVHGSLKIGEQSFDNIGYAENVDQTWKKEPLKDAASDALKRCAALAGVARYLYEKDAPQTPQRPQNGHSAPTPIRAANPPSSTVMPEDFDWEELSPVKPGAVAVAERPLSDGESYCPVHNLAWVLKPAGTSKTGKAYGAFWACGSKDRPFCNEKPTAQWVGAHRQ